VHTAEDSFSADNLRVWERDHDHTSLSRFLTNGQPKLGTCVNTRDIVIRGQ